VETDFPCKCGHNRNDHYVYCYPYGISKSVTRIQCMVRIGDIYADNCAYYSPDNLKYLERLSER
jgi:hypothetical protein